MAAKRRITRDDLMPMSECREIRGDKRRALRALKERRRLAVGPDATFYFESYETMLHQVHEMLFIEQGGEAQIADELAAYNPLVPKGRELVATARALKRHRPGLAWFCWRRRCRFSLSAF